MCFAAVSQMELPRIRELRQHIRVTRVCHCMQFQEIVENSIEIRSLNTRVRSSEASVFKNFQVNY